MLQYSIKKYIQCAFIYFSFNITDKNKTYQDALMKGQQYFEFWIETLCDNSNSAEKNAENLELLFISIRYSLELLLRISADQLLYERHPYLGITLK